MQQILLHDVIIPFHNLAISNSWKIAFFDDIIKPVTTRKVQVRWKGIIKCSKAVLIMLNKFDGVAIVEFVQINIGWVVLLDIEENQTFLPKCKELEFVFVDFSFRAPES